MTLNDTEYFYIRNGQGDITGLIDTAGTQVVSYIYDSWGKLISIDGSLKDTVGLKNPYRYRGYRYDTETGLYYLQSRYYNPEMGRYINADDVEFLGATGTLLSYNLFGYCDNNPVNKVDYNGNEPITLTILGICFLVTALITLFTINLATNPEFLRSWNRMCTAIATGISSCLGTIGSLTRGTVSWASSQAKSIAKSIGDSFAQTKTRPKYRNNYELHHLVAKAAPNASYAAKILREVLPREVEDSANKLLIKTGLHRRIHTNIYYGWANSIVISAYNAANGNRARQRINVYAALATIRSYVQSLNAFSPY
jgi:RHS repeat-associated protein